MPPSYRSNVISWQFEPLEFSLLEMRGKEMQVSLLWYWCMTSFGQSTPSLPQHRPFRGVVSFQQAHLESSLSKGGSRGCSVTAAQLARRVPLQWEVHSGETLSEIQCLLLSNPISPTRKFKSFHTVQDSRVVLLCSLKPITSPTGPLMLEPRTFKANEHKQFPAAKLSATSP